MDSVITFAAQYLLFIMVAAFAAIWLFGTDRAGKLRLGGAAVIGLVVGVVFLVAAGKLHSDPRPFVQNPRLHPLFQHARDNGSILVRLSRLLHSPILLLLNIPSMVKFSSVTVIIIVFSRHITSIHAAEMTGGALFPWRMMLTLLPWQRRSGNLNWLMICVSRQMLRVFKTDKNSTNSSVSGHHNTTTIL